MRFRSSHLPVLIVLAGAVAGCNLSKLGSTTANNSVASTSSSTTPTETPTPTPKATPQGIVDTIRRSPGKYPYEMKLLDNKELQARLRKIMGGDFAEMKSRFQVETPIEVVNSIAMTSGCQAHNCINIYYVIVDPTHDNINVIHVEDEKVTNYFEKGRIKLPEKFASQIPDISDTTEK